MKTLITAALLGVAIALAPSAHADDTDFLVAMDQAGIHYESPFTMIDLGRSVCDAMSVGASAHDIGKIIMKLFTPIQAGVIVSSATVHLCPDQLTKIPATIQR